MKTFSRRAKRDGGSQESQQQQQDGDEAPSRCAGRQRVQAEMGANRYMRKGCMGRAQVVKSSAACGRCYHPHGARRSGASTRRGAAKAQPLPDSDRALPTSASPGATTSASHAGCRRATRSQALADSSSPQQPGQSGKAGGGREGSPRLNQLVGNRDKQSQGSGQESGVSPEPAKVRAGKAGVGFALHSVSVCSPALGKGSGQELGVSPELAKVRAGKGGCVLGSSFSRHAPRAQF